MTDKKIKLDNSNSMFAKKNEEKKQSEQLFNQEVNSHQEKQNALVNKVSQLTAEYMKYIKDNTLNDNKGPLQKEMEQQISKQLAELSLELNNDDTQPEGIGSTGMILILLKVCLLQKDFINELSYRISKLENTSSQSKDGK